MTPTYIHGYKTHGLWPIKWIVKISDFKIVINIAIHMVQYKQLYNNVDLHIQLKNFQGSICTLSQQ